MPPRQATRRQGYSRSWIAILIGGIGILGLMAGVVIYMIATDDSADVSTTVKAGASAAGWSTGGAEGGADKVFPGPASRYSPGIRELPGGAFNVNGSETFVQNISTFASSYLFTSSDQGSQLAAQWKILDGYNVIFDPDGLNAGVLKGGFYVSTETYLFNDTDGAKAAFAYIDQLHSRNQGSVKKTTKGLGNQSSAYEIVQGTVGSSDMKLVYDRFVVRRGNIVSIVMTTGGEPYMTIDQAREVAVIIDDRILGNRASNTPTPLPTPSFNNIAPTAAPGQLGTPTGR